jgi:PiT family inorganic phosphate transporter
LLILASSITFTTIGLFFIKKVPTDNVKKRRDRFAVVEKKFAIIVAFTTCAMVFAHGANDVSIAIGPLSVIYSLVHHVKEFSPESYPSWITLLGCAGVVSGFVLYGRKVIETVGSSITALTPSRAFAATIAAASTVVFSTSTGIPVSATQTLVGAVLGVGLTKGIGALNLIVIRNIFMSWIVTLPVSSILTIACYHLIHYIDG